LTDSGSRTPRAVARPIACTAAAPITTAARILAEASSTGSSTSPGRVSTITSSPIR